jgi:hypothetical protein
MADNACLPPGVGHERHFWGDIYTGTPQALIAAGLITAEQVPEPKKNRRFCNGQLLPPGYPAPRDEAALVVRWCKKNTLSASFSLDWKGRARRSEEDKAEAARLNAAKQAAQDLEYNSDPENLRKSIQLQIRVFDLILKPHIAGTESEYKPNFLCRFSSEGVDEVFRAIDTLREWIDTVEIRTVDATAHRLEIARMDRPFLAFMQSQCLK